MNCLTNSLDEAGSYPLFFYIGNKRLTRGRVSFFCLQSKRDFYISVSALIISPGGYEGVIHESEEIRPATITKSSGYAET